MEEKPAVSRAKALTTRNIRDFKSFLRVENTQKEKFYKGLRSSLQEHNLQYS